MVQQRIFVAGHRGMVGSAIVRKLEKDPRNVILKEPRSNLDLTNQAQVNAYFANNKIDQVYLAAAKVGGIHANNTYPADFIYENLMIESNIINAAHANDVQKLLFLGSSCIYPKLAPQPMSEDSLLTGPLEQTNEPYALAKIAGIKLCESYNRQHGRDYRSVMPTNLYGPGDNYHPENSHVIPALIGRFYEAKVNSLPEVIAWGTGSAMREFLYVDDLATAAVLVMNIDRFAYRHSCEEMCSHINVGTGSDISIKDLTYQIARTIGYRGSIRWDASKPDGTPKKLLDVSKLKSFGWEPTVDLETGLAIAFRDYLVNLNTERRRDV